LSSFWRATGLIRGEQEGFSGVAVIRLADAPCVEAPDGSDVHILAALEGGSMAHFSLPPGKVSLAVRHRTVEEIWFVLEGKGRMWQIAEGQQKVIALEPGLSLTIPIGTGFQFRNDGATVLKAVAITMPPWPGEDEAVLIDGHWPAGAG
jgi:mannose-6-phosphate isomerase-like protein (cupin superfamily)